MPVRGYLRRWRKSRKTADITIEPVEERHVTSVGSYTLSESPLLSLPREIRDEIWRLCLGNRTIHICRPNKVDVTHVLCQASMCEDEAYAMAQRQNTTTEAAPTQIADTRYISYDYRHSPCHTMSWSYATDIKKPRPVGSQLQLSLMRISRQCYHEMFPILWSSNLFAISKFLSSTAFFDHRTTAQMQSIRKLSMHPDDPLRLGIRAMYEETESKSGEVQSWIPYIAQLPNLEVFYLSCQLNFLEEDLGYWWIFQTLLPDDVPMVRHLRQMERLRSVYVRVESASDFQYMKGSIELDREQKMRLGRQIERLIMDPKEPKEVVEVEPSGEVLKERTDTWFEMLNKKAEAVRRNPRQFIHG